MLRKLSAALVIFCLFLPAVPLLVSADESTAEDTAGNAEEYAGDAGEYADGSYGILIDDQAGLFTDEQEQTLYAEMDPLARYGDFILHTTDVNDFGDTEDYAKDYFDRQLGQGDTGSVFVIDMLNRQLYIWSDGGALDVITPYHAQLITDNIYEAAHEGDYTGAVTEALRECLQLWEGGEINAPMKDISTALIAIAAALLINLLIMLRLSSSKKVTISAMVKSADVSHSFSNINPVKTGTTRVYSPASDSSDSGGGGGGDSGGGGGHGF
jgi:uncharacterized protein